MMFTQHLTGNEGMDFMKLTKKQQEVVNRFLELEKECGAGNIFTRYINE